MCTTIKISVLPNNTVIVRGVWHSQTMVQSALSYMTRHILADRGKLTNFKSSWHYYNTPMQYTAVFRAEKIFVQTYIVVTRSNEYPQSMSYNNNKKTMYISVNPVLLYKRGVQVVTNYTGKLSWWITCAHIKLLAFCGLLKNGREYTNFPQ